MSSTENSKKSITMYWSGSVFCWYKGRNGPDDTSNQLLQLKTGGSLGVLYSGEDILWQLGAMALEENPPRRLPKCWYNRRNSLLCWLIKCVTIENNYSALENQKQFLLCINIFEIYWSISNIENLKHLRHSSIQEIQYCIKAHSNRLL